MKTPSAAMPQSCATCYFFLQTSEKLNKQTRETQQIGYCRANPPIPYFEVDSDTGVFTPKIGRFPVVLNNMWCGNFDYKDEKSAETTTIQETKLLRNLAVSDVAKIS